MKKFIRLFMCISAGFLLVSMPVLAQKPNVEVTFTVKSGPFSLKFRPIRDFETKALDTLIKGLNEYISFANFTKDPQVQKLTVELKSAGSANNGSLSNYFLEFTFDPHDGSEINQYTWDDYLDYEAMSALTNNIDEGLADLSRRWFEHLNGHYDEGLMKELFNNLYLIIPSQCHYTTSYKVVFPESKKALKLNTELSKFRVAVEYDDDPENFISDETAPYTGDFQDNVPAGSCKLKGCVTVQLDSWGNRRPVRGKVYFTEFKRKVYVTLTPQ